MTASYTGVNEEVLASALPRPCNAGAIYAGRMRSLLLATLLAACSNTTDEPIPAVYFEMYYGGTYDPAPFNEAWLAARANPASGLDYTFPLVTVDLEPGTQVRLLAGRSSNDPGSPSTTADDVVIAEERLLATSVVEANGQAAFEPLGVAEGNWTSDSKSIPVELLCGNTVIAVRAFERGTQKVPAYRFLASTFMVAVTACD